MDFFMLGFGGLMGLLLMACALVFWIVHSYNVLVRTGESYEKSWKSLESFLKQRFIQACTLLANSHGLISQDIFDELLASRNKILSARSIGDRLVAESSLSRTIYRVLQAAQDDPVLKENAKVSPLLISLKQSQVQLDTARDQFNAVVALYNKRVRAFPLVLVAAKLGHTPVEAFGSGDSANR